MMVKLQKGLAVDRWQLYDTNCFRSHQSKIQFLQIYFEGWIATLLFLFCPCLDKDCKHLLHFHVNLSVSDSVLFKFNSL